MDNTQNFDSAELAKFALLADSWWDTNGECKPLHDLNPVRMDYVSENANLSGASLLDVGCGGGIFSETLHQAGAIVTAIDANESLIAAAQIHAERNAVRGVNYVCSLIENLDEQAYDIITCMELLEHVPDPSAMINECVDRLAVGGHIFFSTINRNAKAYLTAVLGAEYVARILPRGTHDYARFIKPSELARWGRRCGLELQGMRGLSYNPFSGNARLRSDLGVNYIAHFVKS